jgi:hypothetical protein
MASFAYLKFKLAKPPCMVYWSTNPKYLLRNLEQIIGFKQIISEGKSFKSSFTKIKELIDSDEPVMAGALDMYYLHYYPEIYHKHHVPIHYFLVVGYNDEKEAVLVHDCGRKETQEVPYGEFEKALNVKVPGMSRKNTFRVFKFSESIPSEFEVAKRGFIRKAEQMLKPPVKMFGIPAIRKLAQEINTWNDSECFTHLVTYATTPPQVPSTFEHSDGMRLVQANVLETLGQKYGIKEWTDASIRFRQSGSLIIDVCKAAMKKDTQTCSEFLKQIADIEEEAYRMLVKRN